MTDERSAADEHSVAAGHPDRDRSRALAKGLFTFGTLALALAWVGRESSAPAVLHAATQSNDRNALADLDGDGLVDALELRLGTSITRSDSDADGYSDAEELARGSVPTNALSKPGLDPVGVALVAYQKGGPLQLVSVLYVGDGDVASTSVSMGARVGSVVRKAPVSYFTQGAVQTTQSGSDAGSLVVVIDAPLDPQLVHRFGSLSFFTTLSHQGKVAAAGVVNIVSKHGLLLEYVVQVGPAPLGGEPPSLGHYEPLDNEVVPKDWLAGQICMQSMVIAATVGPVIVQEVVEAECQSGWDAYCDPGCPATVGTTVETLDPGALLGG